MTDTMQTHLARVAPGAPTSASRQGALAGVAERAGRALLAWAEHRGTVGPRTIDLRRVRRGDELGRPFC